MPPTREQVIEWAQQSGFGVQVLNSIDGDEALTECCGMRVTDELARLAALAYSAGIAEEREACAVAAWSHYADACKRQGVNAMHYGHWCAAALIRARAAIDQLKEQK